MSIIQRAALTFVALLTIAPFAAAQVRPLADRFGNPLPKHALTRLGTKRFRVETWVSSVAFSRDGKWIAAGDGTGLVYLWEAATGKVALQVDSHERWPTVFFSQDGSRLGARNAEGEVRLWETTTGKLVASFRRGFKGNGRRYEQFLFSPDGRRIIAVPDFNEMIYLHNGKLADADVVGDKLEELSIELLEAPGGKLVKRLAKSEPGTVFSDAALSPDGKLLAVGIRAVKSPRKVLRLLDTTTGKLVREITAEGEGWFLSMAFTPDGKTLALGSRDEIVLADVATGKVTGRLTAKMSTVGFVGFTADAKTLVSHSHDDKVRAWNLATRKVQRTFAAEASGHHVLHLPGRLGDKPAYHEWFGKMYGTALSPDGKTFAVGISGCVQLWDIAAGKQLYPEQKAPDRWAEVEYSPDGRLLLVSTLEHACLWDSVSGTIRKELPKGARGGVFSPDGKIIAFGRLRKEDDKEAPVAFLWDIAREKELVRLEHPRKEGFSFRNLAFGPNGRTLLTLGLYRENAGYPNMTSLHRWDTSTGKILNGIIRQDTNAWRSAIASDGRTAAIVLGNGLLLTDVELDEDLWTREDGPPEGMSGYPVFSRDGGFLLLWSDYGYVGIWEIATRSTVARIGLRQEGNLKLAKWTSREKDGKGEQEPPIDQPLIEALAISPDGRLVATAERFNDRYFRAMPVAGPLPLPLIRIWEVATGKEVQRLEGYRSRVTALAFSPDGRRLASAFQNDSVLIWDISRTVAPVAAKQKPIAAKQLDKLWADLAAADGARAYAAMSALQEAPQQAVALLARQVRPVTEAEAKRVRGLLQRLDDKSFRERTTSVKELKALASQYRNLLKKTLQAPGSLEFKRRLEAILREAPRQLPPETLRTVRAIQTLERIGSPEACRVLTLLAGGAAEAHATRVAQTALHRAAVPVHGDWKKN